MAGLPALSGADQETVSELLLRGTGTTTTSLTAAGAWARAGVASTASASTQPRAALARAGNRGRDSLQGR